MIVRLCLAFIAGLFSLAEAQAEYEAADPVEMTVEEIDSLVSRAMAEIERKDDAEF